MFRVVNDDGTLGNRYCGIGSTPDEAADHAAHKISNSLYIKNNKCKTPIDFCIRDMITNEDYYYRSKRQQVNNGLNTKTDKKSLG